MTRRKSVNETEFYAALIAEHSSDSIVVCDSKGRIDWVNEAFTEMTGYVLEDVRGTTPGAFLQGPGSDPQTIAAIRDALRARFPIRAELLNFNKAKEAYWVELSITPIHDADGRHTHYLSIQRDITARKRLEEQSRERIAAEDMRQTERRLLSQTSEWLYAAKSLDELLTVLKRCMETLIPEAEGQLYIYSSARDTLDLAVQWDSIDPPEHFGADECWALRRGRGYAFGTRDIEFPCAHVKGADAPYFCLPIIAQGETIGLFHLAFPAFPLKSSARRNLEEFIEQRWELATICSEQISLAIANVQLRVKLHDQSLRDPLTNLWNRRWFMSASDTAFKQARRSDDGLAVIALDVDHFKRFNDTYGHDAGDLVLRAMGTQLITSVRAPCAAARVGGEEFHILCPGYDAHAAVALADRIRIEINQLSLSNGDGVLPKITVSAGVAVYPRDGADIDALIKSADQALYLAKQAGRNRVVPASDPEPATEIASDKPVKLAAR